MSETFGTKSAYYKAIAKDLYNDKVEPGDKSEAPKEFTAESLMLTKSWLSKENHTQRKNVWEVFKKLFQEISTNGKITNSEKHNYDQITLGQICLFVLLMKTKKLAVCFKQE